MPATTERAAPPARGKKLSMLLWAVARFPGFAVGMAGLAKLYGSVRWDRLFVSWGYPTWFARVTGAIEVAGAILIFIPRTTIYGAVILAATMLGAFLTLITHRGGQFGWGSTPLVYVIWLSIVVFVSWKNH